MGVQFEARLDIVAVDRRGGVLRKMGDIRRNLAYTTNARIVNNVVAPNGDHSLVVSVDVEAGAGDGFLLNITPRLGFNRAMPRADVALDAAQKRWHAWMAAAPQVESAYQSQYYYAWWIMRAGLVNSRYYMTRETMLPSKPHYVGAWQWDCYFHALAYRHIDPGLARDQFRIVLDHQLENGMLPDAVHDEGVVAELDYPISSPVTKPPLLAWIAWKLYEIDGDSEFISEIYEPVKRWHDWWIRDNDRDGDGLCEYQHPFSSGLDNSPLWDDGMPVTSPDLNTYLVMQQDTLCNMAAVLGEADDVRMWAGRADALSAAMITSLWDDTAGLFWARHNQSPVKVRTPFSLFPLLTGRLPQAMTDRLVSHLQDPNSFWTPYPVPTVAIDDARYTPLDMWRGPVWVNVNYMLIEGLRKSGHAGVADRLRARTLDMLAEMHDLSEYFNPITGETPPKAAPMFGWTAALFIDLAIQSARHQMEVT
jgi:glycogen debranching enzyme